MAPAVHRDVVHVQEQRAHVAGYPGNPVCNPAMECAGLRATTAGQDRRPLTTHAARPLTRVAHGGPTTHCWGD